VLIASFKHTADQKLIFIGPLPPPVHGQSVTTGFLLEQIRKRGQSVIAVDINQPAGAKITSMFIRVMRFLIAISTVLVTKGRNCNSPTLYLSVNANMGMYFTAFLACIGRMKKMRIFLHHHTYSHINKQRISMKLLDLTAGSEACHISICDYMAGELQSRYRKIKSTVSLSNIITIEEPVSNPGSDENGYFIIGHLSNLTIEKGVGRVINTFRHLSRQHKNIKLLLAGPLITPEASVLVMAAIKEFGARLEYLGPVYGTEKAAFYASIHVFLFPSLYSMETQGIVNLEAMAYGKPVIAYNQCCIGSDIEGSAGVAINKSENFEERAVPVISRWITDKQFYGQASINTRSRFRELKQQGLQQMDALFQKMNII